MTWEVHLKLSIVKPSTGRSCGTKLAHMMQIFTRIYGDKSSDIIEGLKKNPSVAVPVVLKR